MILVHVQVIHHSSIQPRLLFHNYTLYASSINREHVFNLFSTTNSKGGKVSGKHTKAQGCIIVSS